MMRTLLVAWLCAFALSATTAFGIAMLGCMLRLGNSDLWLAWRPAFVAAARGTVLIALLYIPIVFGMHLLYPWATDIDFTHQRWYLNTPFAVVRAIVYFVAWLVAGRLALSPGPHANSKTSVALLVLFVAANLVVIDWMMALTPKWHSSVFGLRWILDGCLCGTALIIVWRSTADIAIDVPALRRRIDSANLLFALNLGWLYLMFVDYITAWSGNLPDEAGWYVLRFAHGGWYVISAIVVGHAVICSALLMRRAKRSVSILLGIAALTIGLQFAETVWTISPRFDASAMAITVLSLLFVVIFGAIGIVASRLPFTTMKNHGIRADG